jgi:DNA-binding transcriptional LysR family regulator
MREVNLAGLDLNLLPALEALLRRRNVTRAAAEVGLSQPAMSRALARLRGIFGDPLLVRVGGSLAPTPLAEALMPKATAALDGLRGLFRAEDFDPATLERAIRVAAADAQTILLAPRLVARLALEAPGVDLRFEPISRDIMARMERGEVDLCFATAATPLPPGAVSELLARDKLALVMRRGHPAANRDWTLADYAAYSHATVAFFGDRISEIDAALAAAGVERRIALTTPHFMATVAAVAASDLVTTISRAFAHRFAEPLGLVLRRPPLPDALDTTVVALRLRAADPALQWFRRVLREEAAAVYGESGADPLGVACPPVGDTLRRTEGAKERPSGGRHLARLEGRPARRGSQRS